MDWATNQHGVEGRWRHSGSMFGHEVDGVFTCAIPCFVPRCCWECASLDPGERGDCGELLAGPYCEQNVWLPTKTGACKKQKPWRQAPAPRGAS